VSEREIKLQEQIAQLTQRLNDIRTERDNYRTTSEVFARAMNVLTIDNDQLRRQLANARTDRVPPAATMTPNPTAPRMPGVSSRNTLVILTFCHLPKRREGKPYGSWQQLQRALLVI
jgi:regulator of replication initiation timing